LGEFDYKQVIIFRSDLKLAAEEARKRHRTWWEAWLYEGQRKIAVKVKDEKELLEFETFAKDLGLPNALIVDRGLTQIPEGTITCLGIGPAPAELMDRLTGKLKLL
jgi:PTH2 family peptidyl-tRNA hydrolase